MTSRCYANILRVMIIAEIGTAHNGSIDKAKELMDGAVKTGADAVKFQWVYADEILHENTGIVNLPTGQIRLYDRFKALELRSDFYQNCLSYAHSLGVQFVCSPFGIKSLNELIEINPDVIKIASPELNHYPMLQSLKNAIDNGLKTPVMLSSGVSKLKDIEKALEILDCAQNPNQFTLLHCITSYPAPENEYNVRLVKTLHDIFGIQTGISDHSLDPVLVPVLSTIMGGTVIEKHITLSKKTDGLDDPVALEIDQFANMVYSVHQTQALLKRYDQDEGAKIALEQMQDLYGEEKVNAILGTGFKRLAKSESANYGRTNRSLHFMRDMSAGSIVGERDIGVLRTEKVLSVGLPPEYLSTIIGAKLTADVKSGEGAAWEHFLSR